MSVYSDEDDYYESEDEEYAPLQMTSWGNRGETATSAGVPELNITKMGWDSLIDPNARVGPGGLGSGGLHRKGANYKPVSEEYILAQRSGKKPPNPPGTGKKNKKKRPEGSATPPSSTRGRGGARGGSARGGFSRGGYHSSTPSPSPSPASRSSTIRQPANNAWGSSKLADTPFWEQPAGIANTASNRSTPALSSNASSTSSWAPAPAAPRPGVAGAGTSSGDSKWASSSTASKWAPQNLQSNPLPTAPQQPSQQPPRSYQSAPAPSPSQYHPPPQQPAQPSAVGSGASKWASATSSSADSKWASKPAAPQAPAPPAAAAPPLPPAEANPIMFTMRLEIADGVYAEIVVRRENDINSLVDEFLARHHLQIDPEKKLVFGKRLQEIIDSVQKGQQQN